MPPGIYTGRIREIRVVSFPRRRRPLVRGRIKADHRFRDFSFEIYTEPGKTFRKDDRVMFELDDAGSAVNIRRQRFALP